MYLWMMSRVPCACSASSEASLARRGSARYSFVRVVGVGLLLSRNAHRHHPDDLEAT
jgi:hypothetical protein